jgi:hypothetical protein
MGGGGSCPTEWPLVGEVVVIHAVAEGIGTKLNRLLFGFLGAEVLPQAMRAAELGIDPTPLLEVVATSIADVCRWLERPGHGTH